MGTEHYLIHALGVTPKSRVKEFPKALPVVCITKTRPCNIWRFFVVVKMIIFI